MAPWGPRVPATRGFLTGLWVLESHQTHSRLLALHPLSDLGFLVALYVPPPLLAQVFRWPRLDQGVLFHLRCRVSPPIHWVPDHPGALADLGAPEGPTLLLHRAVHIFLGAPWGLVFPGAPVDRQGLIRREDHPFQANLYPQETLVPQHGLCLLFGRESLVCHNQQNQETQECPLAQAPPSARVALELQVSLPHQASPGLLAQVGPAAPGDHPLRVLLAPLEALGRL